MKNRRNLNGGFIGILVLLIIVAGTVFLIVRTDLFIGEKGGKSMLDVNKDAIDDANALKIKLEQNSSYTFEE